MCFQGPVSLLKKALPFHIQSPSLLMLGLDNAGKSTLTIRLAQILCGDAKEATKEASEWNFKVGNSKLKWWDMNGDLKNRQIWPNYYHKVKILIYVIDCKDSVRLGEARCVLCDVLMHEELKKVPLLVVCNKKESFGCVSPSSVIDLLGLKRLEGRDWALKECSVPTGEGIQ
ncbi:hypothetical protein KR018_011118, partial [Drosophila ironensis]